MPNPPPPRRRASDAGAPNGDANSLRSALERIQQSRTDWEVRRQRGLATDPFEDPEKPSDELREALLRLWVLREGDPIPDAQTIPRCEACLKHLGSDAVVIQLTAEVMLALGADPGTVMNRRYVFCNDCAQQARDLLDWLQREGGVRR